jgi:hypothetical protein
LRRRTSAGSGVGAFFQNDVVMDCSLVEPALCATARRLIRGVAPAGKYRGALHDERRHFPRRQGEQAVKLFRSRLPRSLLECTNFTLRRESAKFCRHGRPFANRCLFDAENGNPVPPRHATKIHGNAEEKSGVAAARQATK